MATLARKPTKSRLAGNSTLARDSASTSIDPLTDLDIDFSDIGDSTAVKSLAQDFSTLASPNKRMDG